MERRTVLITLDGSAVAEAALPYGRALAAALGARIELLAVVEPAHGILPGQRDAAGSALQAAIGDMESYLDAVTEQLFAHESGIFRRVIGGDPVEEILTASREPDIAAVALATHGRGGVRRAVLGSVADKLIHRAQIPLLIVRPGVDQPAVQRLQRIMAPLDGSPLAETALPLATEVARASGATLLLVRAEAPLATRGVASELMPGIRTSDRHIAAQAEVYLAGMRAHVPQNMSVEIVVGTFDAMDLPSFAQQQAVDLVVMTTHGRGGLSRLVLGSVADRMVRSGPPVLLVPRREPAVATAADEKVKLRRDAIVQIRPSGAALDLDAPPD